MVSLYFHRVRELTANNPVAERRFGKRYDKLFGKGWDPNDSIKNLRAFIHDEFARPRDSRQNWREHVMNWHDGGRGRKNVVYLNYEELINEHGDLRILPTHLSGQGGMDGFFVSRLTRVG